MIWLIDLVNYILKGSTQQTGPHESETGSMFKTDFSNQISVWIFQGDCLLSGLSDDSVSENGMKKGEQSAVAPWQITNAKIQWQKSIFNNNL